MVMLKKEVKNEVLNNDKQDTASKLVDNYDPSSVLRELCLKAINVRYSPYYRNSALERLEQELAIINKKESSKFFLMLFDIFTFSKNKNIPIIGMGKSASSIVFYVLGITDIDPLKYNLFFENFLNLNDVYMPLPILLCNTNCNRLVECVVFKYGKDKSAHTFTFAPMEDHSPLIYTSEMICSKDGEIFPTGDGELLDKIGMNKLVFIPSKELTIIEQTIKNIKCNRNISIDINLLPLNDEKTFKLLSNADTDGIIESENTKDMLKKVAPKNFEQLMIVPILARTYDYGMGIEDDYIERKNGNKPITYFHPLLEPILKETYGILLYREQLMRIVPKIAGYTLYETNILNKQLGKKIPEEINKQKIKFISGAKEKGIEQSIAEAIFKQMLTSFLSMKSYYAQDALLSYRGAYLKANFPAEFNSALKNLQVSY